MSDYIVHYVLNMVIYKIFIYYNMYHVVQHQFKTMNSTDHVIMLYQYHRFI